MSEQPAAYQPEHTDRCEACDAPATTRWRSTHIPVCATHADAGACAACWPYRSPGRRHPVAARLLCAAHEKRVAELLSAEILNQAQVTVVNAQSVASRLERAATLPPDDWADIELEPMAGQIRAELAAIERACGRAREALTRIETQRGQP